MGLGETNSNFELRRGTACFQAPALDDTEVLFGWRPQRLGSIGTVSRAKGVYLYDAQDRPILDMASGQVNVNLGHGHEGVLRAMRAQLQDFCYAAPCLNSDVREALTAEIGKVVPFAEDTKVFLCNSGSEAVESAIKLAWAMTGRTKIYAASPSYHGATIGASSISADARRRFAEPGLTGVRHFTPPFAQHLAFKDMSEEEAVHISLSLLRDQITRDGPDTVAAIFVEPVIGSGGVFAWPTAFMQGLREICDAHGILLVFDETMSGWGRTGRWFAAEHSGVTPDILTTAKGITSGYVPLAAVILPKRHADRFDARPFVCGSTTEGHALACATARACLQAYHDENVIARADAMGDHLRQALHAMKSRNFVIKDVRNAGLLGCVELASVRVGRGDRPCDSASCGNWMETLTQSLWRNGVFTIVREHMIFVAPPLTITTAELEQGLGIIERELSAFVAWAA